MTPDSPVARVLDARRRLVDQLTTLVADAVASVPDRCPYRDRDDACTFSAGCRNQLRRDDAPVRCSGACLDSRPA